MQRFTRMRFGGFQQTRQLQLLLLGGEAIQLFEQVGATNQIHQAGNAQRGHQLAHFTGDKFKVVGHFKRQAVIVVLTQFLILSCNTGCAVVQVANTQIFTAQRHHRAGTEAKAFCTQNCRFNDIDAGFQTAIDLQTNLVTQTVSHQRLLGFHQAEFPRAARIFH